MIWYVLCEQDGLTRGFKKVLVLVREFRMEIGFNLAVVEMDQYLYEGKGLM